MQVKVKVVDVEDDIKTIHSKRLYNWNFKEEEFSTQVFSSYIYFPHK